MNIDKIRSALEFARTRTPAGGPVSSQAEAGLMAIAEVEREFAAARKLIEKAAKVVDLYKWEGMAIFDLHTELRAFLEPTAPAVCFRCGDDRNQPSKFCDHGKATPEPAECGCADCAGLREINERLEAVAPKIEQMRDERDQLRAELVAMTADRDQWKALKDRVEEERAEIINQAEIDCRGSGVLRQANDELQSELAAALEREREAVDFIRPTAICDCPRCRNAKEFVARYDARKADALQAEVLRDNAKGDC